MLPLDENSHSISKFTCQIYNNSHRWHLTLVPAAVFWRRLPAAGGGYFTPRHISSSRAHSNKIPTAIPMFSGSNVLMVPLPVSRDVDIRDISKMAVAKMKCTYFTAVWLMKDDFQYSVSDDELSKSVRLSHHVLHLHTLLPPPSTASQNYYLRHRTHSLELPAHTTHLTDCTFITRMLYKDVYSF